MNRSKTVSSNPEFLLKMMDEMNLMMTLMAILQKRKKKDTAPPKKIQVIK